MSFTALQCNQPTLINGGSFEDERGLLAFVNTFHLEGMRRFYVISNKQTSIIRAWQAHQFEYKAFFATRGAFQIAVVEVDDFNSPSLHLRAQAFVLNASQPQLLIVPKGYANGIRSLTDDNQLLVFSSLSLEESRNDCYRYPAEWWYDWGSVNG